MKPHRDAAALAASLTSAAAKPLPLPERQATPAVSNAKETEAPKGKKVKLMADTVGITLRPPRATLNRYTMAAAERTKKEGRVVSAQEVMLEVLETGPKVQP